MPIPAPKDNPPLGLTTTSGIPKRTIMKFVNAKDILKYLSTSHLVLSTPFSFNCLMRAVRSPKLISSGFFDCCVISSGEKLSSMMVSFFDIIVFLTDPFISKSRME